MTTDLNDRYLAAVRRALPESIENRDDIVAELADALQSRIEEGADPVEAVREMGRPELVAARYAKQHPLIGAELLPFYFLILRWVLSVTIALELFAFTSIAVATRSADPLWDGLGTAWQSLFMVTGVVTVLFAVYERIGTGGNPLARLRWDPNTLPEPNTSGLPDVPRAVSAIEFVVNVCVLLALWIPSRSIFAQLHLAFGAAWQPFVLYCIAACSLIALQCLINLVRPDWVRFREGVRIGTNAILIAGCASALWANASTLGLVLRATLWIAIAAFAWNLVLNIRALMRKNRVEPAIVSHA